jgi:MoaA/NifB/PqqE/SkfB family radical SAM enzyme
MKPISLKEGIQSAGMKAALRFLESNPKKNIPRLLNFLAVANKEGPNDGVVKVVTDAMADRKGNWYQLAESLWSDIDANQRKTIFVNFAMNACIVGTHRQQQLKTTHNCNIPWAILLDPTSTCNLKCTGCWAAEYDHRLNMPLDTWNLIIEQGKQMGIYMFIYSGGEPLVRKADIIRMCDRHRDCVFLSFTNATLIDEDFADEMVRVGNFVPAVSIEGFEEETDFRRGEGTYKRAMDAIDILRRKKLLFGISSCYTSKNVETIGSERYFDAMIERGAKFAWFFTYIPVGADAVPELMVTAEQREFMYHQLRAFRNTKPIFTIDFWNDGELVKGCIAGGRSYLHINANGDIEPCAFIHYSDSNIRKMTLLEACKSPLFMQYYKSQPFNENMLRPCPLLDNPEKLKQMVHISGALSTDMQKPENVDSLCEKCMQTSERWAETADKLWYANHERLANESKCS